MLISHFLAFATMLIPPLLTSAKNSKQKTRVLIMLGPPGAGKGTQATILKETLNIPHISTGDLLRTNIKEGTDLGEKAQIFMNKGELVPDNLILDMLFDRVSKEDCQVGYILDGFPRTLPQAHAFQKRLNETSNVIAIHLDLPDEEIVQRLSNRVVCSFCNAPYHLIYFPPKKEMTCDTCSSGLIQRSDDKEEVIRSRLEVYHKQTKPLITYYSKQKNLQKVDCNKPKDKITKDIFSILRKVD